jgi:hypothetical protein
MSSPSRWPVSANPAGIYEGWMYQVFPPYPLQPRWNSFNAGEFLFKGRSWSMALTLAIVGFMVIVGEKMAAKIGLD